MVTSQNMIEREMDNRGSKSVSGWPASHKSGIVKEQRVDGSWPHFFPAWCLQKKANPKWR